MANIKISELEKLTNVASDDYFPIVDSSAGKTKKTEINSILNLVFPIGRGFIDFTDADFSNYLGFTWERTLVGLTPVGLDTSDTDFDTIGKTGGSKYTEKHSHGQYIDAGGSKTPYTLANVGGQSTSGKYLGENYNDYTGPQVLTTEFGTGNAGNLQPYQVVAYWKRIA